MMLIKTINRTSMFLIILFLGVGQSQTDSNKNSKFVPGGKIPEGHPDYTSKVPKYIFSTTLKKQEKELKKAILNAKNLIKENPIIRMYESIILYNSEESGTMD